MCLCVCVCVVPGAPLCLVVFWSFAFFSPFFFCCLVFSYFISAVKLICLHVCMYVASHLCRLAVVVVPSCISPPLAAVALPRPGQKAAMQEEVELARRQAAGFAATAGAGAASSPESPPGLAYKSTAHMFRVPPGSGEYIHKYEGRTLGGRILVFYKITWSR